MDSFRELVLDVTALVGNPLSGIQRVILETAPRLAKLAQERGVSVALAHCLGQRFHVIHRWESRVTEEAIRERLAKIQKGEGVWRLRALGERILGLIGYLTPRVLSRNLTSKEFRSWLKELALTRFSFGGLGVKPQSKLLVFSGGISPLHIPPEIAINDVTVVVHDLIPIWHREYVPIGMGAEFVNRLLPVIFSEINGDGARFVVPTQAAREDLLDFCWGLARVRPEVASVAWGFNAEQFFPDEDAALREDLGIPANGFLVLAVSSHDPRKRFDAIEQAIQAVAEDLPIYGLFTGARPHTQAPHPCIRFLGHVADDKLRQLYSTCDAYVNWSAAEGFGLPIIEALACGARVIVPHDTAALREVGGRHVLSPAHTSVSGLTDLLRDLCQRRPARSEKPDLSDFNWDRSAQLIDQQVWSSTARTELQLLREVA